MEDAESLFRTEHSDFFEIPLERRKKLYLEWIESIERARIALFLDPSVDRASRLEIEDQLLRDLQIRTDRDHEKHANSVARWARYTSILLEQPGTPEKLERLNSSDPDIVLKREAWQAARDLFREIGGGCSDSHVRQEMRKLAEVMRNGDPASKDWRLPIPTGDAPPAENG